MRPRHTSIPEPEYITETVEGAVFDLPGGAVLVVGAVPEALASRPARARGTLILRYGIPMNSPVAEPVIPGLMVGERGGALVGREAWEFMMNRFQMFPRADVVGFRPGGAEAQVFLRELDFGAQVRVYVFESTEARKALAEVTALFRGEGVPELPEMLTRHLPTLPDAARLLGTG